MFLGQIIQHPWVSEGWNPDGLDLKGPETFKISAHSAHTLIQATRASVFNDSSTCSFWGVWKYSSKYNKLNRNLFIK